MRRLPDRLSRSVNKIRAWFRGRLLELYYPSRASLASCLLLTVVLLTPALIIDHLVWCRLKAEILVATHAGLVAVLFPLIVFTAGFSATSLDSGVRRSEVLLKHSQLFPLSFFALSTFLLHLAPRALWASLWSILLVLVGTLYAIYNVVRLSVDEGELFEAGIGLLRDAVRRGINLAIAERDKNADLLRRIAPADSHLEYRPIREREATSRFVSIPSSQYGTVRRIDLERLQKALYDLARRAEQREFPIASWLEGVHLITLGLSPARPPNAMNIHRGLLLKRFGSSISGDDPYLLQIPEDLLVDADRRALERRVQACFELDTAKLSHSQKTRFTLINLRDSIVRALDERRMGALERLTNIYLNLGREFLDALRAHPQNEKQERQALETVGISLSLDEVAWIKADLDDLLGRALRGGDREAIEVVLRVHVGMLSASIENRELSVFNSFRNFPVRMYRQSFEVGDARLRNYLREQSRRLFTDSIDFFLVPRLRVAASPAERAALTDCAMASLFTFRDLLILALERRDTEGFTNYCTATNGVLSWYYESLHLAHNRNEAESAFRAFNSRRQVTLYGVASLVLERLFQKPRDQRLQRMYGQVTKTLPNAIPALSELFAQAYRLDSIELWGWVDLQTSADADAIEFVGPVARLFAIELLHRAQAMPPAQIADLRIDDEKTHTRIAELNDFSKVVEDLATQALDTGIPIAKPGSLELRGLLTLLDRIKAEHDARETERVITSMLSVEGLQAFRSGVQEGFHSDAAIRRIIRSGLGTYEDRTTQEATYPSSSPFGLKRLTSKAVLLADGIRGYHATGVQFGSGVGRGETRSLIRDIIRAIPPRACLLDSSSSAVKAAIRDLSGSVNYPNVIFVINCLEVLERWRACNELIPDTGGRYAAIDGYEGVFGGAELPIFHLYGLGFERIIVVFNLKEFSLIQYSPEVKGEFCQARVAHLCASLTDLNADVERREKIRQQGAEQLAAQQDPDRYLRRAVLVEVIERFSFLVRTDGTATGLCVNVSLG
jgi:hypothetical protein